MIHNNMTKLINKVERRLGVRQLNLPPEIAKDTWAEIVIEDTIPAYSKFYPYEMQYFINREELDESGTAIIDEERIGNAVVLGLKDIDFQKLGDLNFASLTSGGTYGFYDSLSAAYSYEDVMNVQAAADYTSMFNNGLYPLFEYPNKITIRNCLGRGYSFASFPITLLVNHFDNLNTISPTTMETFEKLAIADIATYLYGELKYYDNLETVFGNVNIKLEDIKEQADKREDVIQYLQDNYVSAGNKNQPMMFTV